MLMGKVRYRCNREFTTLIIPADCIETFCVGKNFPLDQASGRVSIATKEGAVLIAPIREKDQHQEMHGSYTRDQNNIRVILPAGICQTVFETEEEEGELRIEIVNDTVLASKV